MVLTTKNATVTIKKKRVRHQNACHSKMKISNYYKQPKVGHSDKYHSDKHRTAQNGLLLMKLAESHSIYSNQNTSDGLTQRLANFFRKGTDKYF